MALTQEVLNRDGYRVSVKLPDNRSATLLETVARVLGIGEYARFELSDSQAVQAAFERWVEKCQCYRAVSVVEQSNDSGGGRGQVHQGCELNVVSDKGRVLSLSWLSFDGSHFDCPALSGEWLDLTIFREGFFIPAVGFEELLQSPEFEEDWTSLGSSQFAEQDFRLAVG